MAAQIDTAIPPLVNTASGATILGVSRTYVHRCCTEGRIPFRYVGDPDTGYQHIVIREDLVRQYAEEGIPAKTTGKPRVDRDIPKLLRVGQAAVVLDISRATVNKLYNLGLIKGRPVPGKDLETVDSVVFRPVEVQKAERGLETRKAIKR